MDSLSICARVVRYFGHFLCVILSPVFFLYFKQGWGKFLYHWLQKYESLRQKTILVTCWAIIFQENLNMKIWGFLNSRTISVTNCYCSFEKLHIKKKKIVNKSPEWGRNPHTGQDHFPAKQMQLRTQCSSQEEWSKLLAQSSQRGWCVNKWRFGCLSLCTAWTLFPEEHKYLLLTYSSEVTSDINADPKNLYFAWNSVLCQY